MTRVTIIPSIALIATIRFEGSYRRSGCTQAAIDDGISGARDMKIRVEHLILIPLVIATAIIGIMLFTGDTTQAPPQEISETEEFMKRKAQQKVPLFLPNTGPPYRCASWMPDDLCAKLQQSCANGVCEPWERCNTCAFDCGCGGSQICNTETGRCHSPAEVCAAPRGR